MTADRDRLAQHVAIRRRELGLSYGRIEMLCGPSVGVTSKIERGLIAPREDTLYKLDRGLSWKPGTSWAILHGHARRDPATWTAPSPPRGAAPTPPRDHDQPCAWKTRYDNLRTQTTSIRKRSMQEDYRYWAYATEVAETITEQATHNRPARST